MKVPLYTEGMEGLLSNRGRGRTLGPVLVDHQACRRLAQVLASSAIPIDKEDSGLAGFDRLEAGNFYLLLVAICHQTSPRGRPALQGTVAGELKRGWDYLSAKLESAVQSNRELLNPARWAEMSLDELTAIFRDQSLGDLLDDPATRLALIRDLGSVCLGNRWRWFEVLYELSGRRVATGENSLFSLLSRFHAYRDPVKKKSCFVLSLMRNSKLWTYLDDDQLGPPVDYHEVRGHLRIGTVRIASSSLDEKLHKGIPVTAAEDVAIRQAVYDAIMLLSDLSGLRNPSQLHYLFWNIFRSYCVRENPFCTTPCQTVPERYRHLLSRDGDTHCPFASVCASVDTKNRYYEHVFETDFY
jgi:hypothetical protein